MKQKSVINRRTIPNISLNTPNSSLLVNSIASSFSVSSLSRLLDTLLLASQKQVGALISNEKKKGVIEDLAVNKKGRI
jgi:hypothetical protein